MKNDLIDKYCIEHSEHENNLQKKIRKYTFEHESYPQMISGIIVGNFLCSLIKSMNARKILELQKKCGSFKSWLEIKNDSNLNLNNWVILFKENFKFTGSEITKEFLTSTGYIKGAHVETCPILDKTKLLN